ncbi:MAG: hypothetical protein IT347_12210 [Candidatus Eisenbacteria bacterium]|nr:hypothetical protein [Candidatus Eisenbacteria bacterium]
MSAPRDPAPSPLDWNDLRASVRRRVSSLLRGWSSEDIEDITQDVFEKLLKFTSRSGPPDDHEALLTVIARRTVVSRIRKRARRPAHEPITESLPAPDEAEGEELAELEALTEWRALLVIEFFRAGPGDCLDLAEARRQGIDFKQLPTKRPGDTHQAKLQRWARCRRSLRAAIAAGKLPWNGPGKRP